MHLDSSNKLITLSILVFILLFGYINPDYFNFSYKVGGSINFDFYFLKYILNISTLLLISYFVINFFLKTRFKKIRSQIDKLDILIFLTLFYFFFINFFLHDINFENLKKNIQILICLSIFFITRFKFLEINLKLLITFLKSLLFLIFSLFIFFKIIDNELFVFQNSSNAVAMICFISASIIIMLENENKKIFFYILLSLAIFYFLSSKIFLFSIFVIYLIKNIKLKINILIPILILILLNNFIIPKILIEKYPLLRNVNLLSDVSQTCQMFTSPWNYGFRGKTIYGEYFFDYDDFYRTNKIKKSLRETINFCSDNSLIFLTKNTKLLIVINNVYLSFSTRYNLFEIATNESLNKNLFPVKEKFSIKKNLINSDLGNSFHSSFTFLLYTYGFIGLALIFGIFYYISYINIKFNGENKKVNNFINIFFICILFLSLENYIFFNNIICSSFFWFLAGMCAKKIN